MPVFEDGLPPDRCSMSARSAMPMNSVLSAHDLVLGLLGGGGVRRRRDRVIGVRRRWEVAERRRQGDAGPAFGRGLGGIEDRDERADRGERVGDVHQLDGGLGRQQGLGREQRVEVGVHQPDAATEHAAQRQAAVEQLRVLLQESGAHLAAERRDPRRSCASARRWSSSPRRGGRAGRGAHPRRPSRSRRTTSRPARSPRRAAGRRSGDRWRRRPDWGYREAPDRG